MVATKEATLCLSAVVLLVYQSVVICQSSLGSCDYQKFPVNGCEDELGSDCDSATMECRCKPGNWLVIDRRFCFPTQCPKGEYYDHNLMRCDKQRKASLNSDENYCKHHFHCKGSHVGCYQVNEWNNRCVCDRGFVYDSSTEECHKIQGLNGFCESLDDCDKTRLRNFICVEHSCHCAEGFTYNYNIDGCEDNKDVQKRDNDYRKMIYIFIGLGLFFGAALSLKFGASSASATQQLLLKRIIEQRQLREMERRQREQQQQPREDEEDLEEIVVDDETESKGNQTDRTERLIDRETA